MVYIKENNLFITIKFGSNFEEKIHIWKIETK